MSEEHFNSIERDGFAVFRNVIPARLVEHAVEAVCRFGGFSLDDERTWYRNHPDNNGIVPLHHAQALWDIRQHPALHEVFAEIWGTARLTVNMDRCCFRPPHRQEHATSYESNLHWDIDPREPLPERYQGTVYLSDVGQNGGGFQCVPSVYRDLDGWLAAQAAEFDYDEPSFPDDRVIQIEGRAGDLIVWRPSLPHGPAPNTSDRPRIGFFVNMRRSPIDEGERLQSVSWWRENRAPPWWRGLPGQLDPEPGPPARLTPLGRKLVGSDTWD